MEKLKLNEITDRELKAQMRVMLDEDECAEGEDLYSFYIPVESYPLYSDEEETTIFIRRCTQAYNSVKGEFF